MSAVVVEQLVVRRGATVAVDNVSFQVVEGGGYGLLGTNGSGKSSLLKTLATLLRPSSGRALVCGRDVVEDTLGVRRVVGYVPEEVGVYRGLSVWQHLEFLARCRGLDRAEREETIETLLQVVDLYDARHEEASALSRGLRRRLALAGALVHSPRVLLIEDPFAELDSRARLEIVEVLRELRTMGTTLVVASNHPDDLLQVCTDVAILDRGRLLWSGPASAVPALWGLPASWVMVQVLEEVDRAVDVLGAAPEVTDLVAEGETLTFQFGGDDRRLAELLRRLVEQGVLVASFHREPPDVDRVLASLGRASGAA